MSNLFGSTMLTTTVMPIASNCFMTFAWYAHLKNLSDKPWFIAALISWGIAVRMHVDGAGQSHRLHHDVVGAIEDFAGSHHAAVFVPFAVLYMGETLRWNYQWAGLCLMGAVYFIFKC